MQHREREEMKGWTPPDAKTTGSSWLRHTRCVAWDKLLTLSEPRCPHLWDGNNAFCRMVWGLSGGMWAGIWCGPGESRPLVHVHDHYQPPAHSHISLCVPSPLHRSVRACGDPNLSKLSCGISHQVLGAPGTIFPCSKGWA